MTQDELNKHVELHIEQIKGNERIGEYYAALAKLLTSREYLAVLGNASKAWSRNPDSWI